MIRLILTDEQTRLVAASAAEEVQLTDSQGRVLGVFIPCVSAADLQAATASLQSSERRYTTAEVIDHLGRLRAS